MKEYMALIEDADKITGPTELTLTIRDMTPGQHKYTGHNVVATVSPSPISGGDSLQLRHSNGRLLPAPYYIKIKKELEDYFKDRPYSGIVD